MPVVIPPGVDAEHHLAVSDKHEGWRELGDILQALRAHDKRIEDALPEMLTIQLPPEEPPAPDLVLRTVVAVGRQHRTSLEYAVVTCSSIDDAEDIARAAVAERRPLLDYPNTEHFNEGLWADPGDEPTSLIVHAERPDGTTVTRADTVARRRTTRSGPLGRVNLAGTRRRARQVAQGERGRRLPDSEERKRTREERERKREERRAAKLAAFEAHVQGVLLDLSERMGNGIAMNLLTKSGLTGNKVQRDLNLLDAAVTEAARYLHDEGGLAAALDTHFGLDNLSAPKKGKPRADGSTIAALLWMNAAMLHQRVHAGGWLGRRGIDSLADIKTSTEPEEGLRDSWNAITRQDFLPVIEPAELALSTARRTGRLGRTPPGVASPRRRSRTDRRDLRRHGHRPRRGTVQQSDGRPILRRGVLHPPGRGGHHREARSRSGRPPRHVGLDPLRTCGATTKPSTWRADREHCSPR